MHQQLRLVQKALAAGSALVRLVTGVQAQVHRERVAAGERQTALEAYVLRCGQSRFAGTAALRCCTLGATGEDIAWLLWTRSAVVSVVCIRLFHGDVLVNNDS